MQWFDHSSTAASDDAIMALRMEHPDSAAVDCYWAIVEKQFHDERPVPFSETNRETKALAHRLFVGFEALEKYVKTMLELGLLKADGGGSVYSERAASAIEQYQKKRETARQNGKSGGRKPKRKPTGKPTPEPTAEPTAKPPRPNTRQNNTKVGFDKQNLPFVGAPGGADARCAPPAAPACPECGSALARTGMRVSGTDRRILRCAACGADFDEREVAR